MSFTEYRSYHGGDGVSAVQFYWPSVPTDLASEAITELDARDWSYIKDEGEREYQRAVFLWKRLGKPHS